MFQVLTVLHSVFHFITFHPAAAWQDGVPEISAVMHWSASPFQRDTCVWAEAFSYSNNPHILYLGSFQLLIIQSPILLNWPPQKAAYRRFKVIMERRNSPQALEYSTGASKRKVPTGPTWTWKFFEISPPGNLNGWRSSVDNTSASLISWEHSISYSPG
jgi:hypothetical protein